MHDVIAKQAVAHSFSQAAKDYDKFAHFQHELAQQLIDLCPDTHTSAVLDLGCGTGYCLPLLKQQYAQADITGADLAPGMLNWAKQQHPDFLFVQGDAENLPFEEHQFDLIFSNLAVQWCADFSKVLSEAYHALKPGGHLVLSTLADGTLNEIERAWQSVDTHQHVNEFEAEAFLSECVKQSDFNVEYLDVSTHIDYHPDVRSLTDSLKRIGAHNITGGRAKGLTSPRAIKQFMQAMESFRSDLGLPGSYRVLSCRLVKPI
ncbi:malonyl-ACP O-methyltransferase BioC [Oceaniserpentilla sp. 4NH20-0058]|uniref:malonyl-ACP O-methyltransferase BioC n=1 Tax=Oceaniserpentilla sp. 4NH20-0058 TaxID=3127660 RepID=UPI0031088F75